jgi:hypothetical protein
MLCIALAFAASTLTLAACSSNNDSGTNPNNTNTMTAKKDGVSWAATTVTAIKDSAGFLLRGVTSVDTMEFHTRGATVGEAQIYSSGRYWKYPSWGIGSEGQCKITSVTATNVQGTFDVYFNDTATRLPIHFSGGAFNINS